MVGGRLWLPLGGRGGRLFHDRVEGEVFGEMMPPAAAINLSLEVVPLPVVGCFFRAMAFERFLRKGLVREKHEYYNSALNRSTSLW